MSKLHAEKSEFEAGKLRGEEVERVADERQG